MKLKKIMLGVGCALGISLCCVNPAWAYRSFVVRHIQVKGLRRIKFGTVLSYLPIRVGDRLNNSDGPAILRALYNTGFFTDVELDHRGNTLIVRVDERPTIASVTVTGNKDIPKKAFNAALKKSGLERGEVYRPDVLDSIKTELKNQYNNRGKYNTRVDATVKSLPRHRVAIRIVISEGVVAKIKEIKILGNRVFSDSTLRKQFLLSSSGLFSFYNKRDQYSRAKLAASLEAVRSYYFNRGYLRFRIISKQVSLSPNKKHVYITIKISEGAQYHVSGVTIKGKLILGPSVMRAMIPVRKGDVFSREKATTGINAIGAALGDKGYGFPVVRVKPKVNERTKTVFLVFYVDPKQRYYVRRITFTGNTKTADYVLRHAMRQREGSLMSVPNIKESERQLRILGYLKDVNAQSKKVPGANNQVDLTFHVKEAPSAVANVALGYGTDGLQFKAGFNQHNFMGTGRTVGVNFSKNPTGTNYGVNYFNPFYRPNGIGRGFNFYYQKFDTSLDISDYTLDRVGGSVNYSIPISEGKSHLNLGGGFEHMRLNLPTTCYLTQDSKGNKTCLNKRSTQQQAFRDLYGQNFTQARLTAAWVYNGYDRLPFPTKGFKQAFNVLLAVPVTKDHSLKYYKVGYRAHAYVPLFSGFIFSAMGTAAYGNGYANTDGLPFFENYFAGGIGIQGQVRGYDTYSLGPKDTPINFGASSPKSLGGNFLVSGTAALILPKPLSRDSFRTSIFVDAGNVYAVHAPTVFKGTSPGPMRYSVGAAVDWQSPFGPLTFSVAKALNDKFGDDTKTFQFSVSSGF